MNNAAHPAPGRTAAAAPVPAEQPPPRRGVILATASLCQLLVVLDAAVVNVALPSISQALDFSSSALPWVINAYILVFGGLLLLGGRIADLVGHRRAMVAGLVLFAVASVLGGFAQDPGQLIAARAGQGLAAAVLAPISLTVIMVTFPEGPARARAVGIWAMVAASGSALGVLLGGLLTELLDWRWVLFVNVPIIAVVLPLALRSVRDHRVERTGRLDVTGAVLGTAAMSVLVYGTVETGNHPWGSARTLATLGIAVLLGIAFLVRERRCAQPIVRLGLFRARPVWISNVIALLIGAAMVVGFYFASLFLQQVLHYGPLAAGAAFLPFCAGTVVGSLGSARLAARLGNRAVLTTGLLLGAVGMALFGQLGVDSTFVGGFLAPCVIASVGIGLCMVANTSMGTTGAHHHEAGLVSGLLNASRQCGGSIGLAALSTVAVAATRHSGSLDTLQALTDGYDRAFLVTAALLLLAAVVAALSIPGGRPAPAGAPAVES
ncbi:MFS transporter [Peterkaempfera bronchialis]|uniref:MFS transporter n=1 Tax=Peterkaempfera bronchialis TaxID=2126346 RepID=A0A345SXQ7_9ACTN|nr:MFS transporter [Peterkaempfera bronchialis]AXI78512.1 MFS transporter [Peterkaempfera bronchialis]